MKEIPHYVTESGRHFSTPEEAEDCERVEFLAKKLEPLMGRDCLYKDGYWRSSPASYRLHADPEERTKDLEKILAVITKRYTLTPIPPPLP